MKRHVLGHIRILMLDSSSVFVRLWHTIFFYPSCIMIRLFHLTTYNQNAFNTSYAVNRDFANLTL